MGSKGADPVAVHRIVNPAFPTRFTMNSGDLLVPGIRRREPLSILVRLNAHGNLGDPKPGDLEGLGTRTHRSGDGDVSVTLDKAL